MLEKSFCNGAGILVYGLNDTYIILVLKQSCLGIYWAHFCVRNNQPLEPLDSLNTAHRMWTECHEFKSHQATTPTILPHFLFSRHGRVSLLISVMPFNEGAESGSASWGAMYAILLLVFILQWQQQLWPPPQAICTHTHWAWIWIPYNGNCLKNVCLI